MCGRRHLVFLLLALLFAPPVASPQDVAPFDRLLAALNRANEGDRHQMVASFVDAQRARDGFPIRDGSGTVVFVYLADPSTRAVRVVGDFLPRSVSNPYWDSAGEPLTRVGSIFYARRRFEPDARLDYRFVVDGVPTLDPLNPRRILSGAGSGEASELVMPSHRQPVTTIRQSGTPQGTLAVVREPWANPTVTVYLPPHYDPTRSYSTIYTADGSAWLSEIGLPTTLDNLIEANRIEPVLAVMIDASDNRSTWYDCNPDYLTYLQRVVSYIDRHYATRRTASARVHAGTSAGAKASLHVGAALPALFGKLGLLSPSLVPRPSCLETYLAGNRPLPRARTWISAGTYEGRILSDAQALSALFRAAGAPVSMETAHQGHSFGAWRESVAGMVEYLLGT